MARRYAPLAVVIAIQLLIIATVPSRAPRESDLTAAGPGLAVGESAADRGASAGDPTGDVFTEGSDAEVNAPVAEGRQAGRATGGQTEGVVRGGGAAPSGDTSHCVAGRQFDPKLYYWAPKCVGKFSGTNGGATYQGVTDKEIKLVVYRGKPNPAVDAITSATGQNPDDRWVTDVLHKMVAFVNDHFELYGRKLVVEEVRGRCDTVPPDYVCLRGEMRDIVRDKKPFGVLWQTVLASPAFDELSALKVMNFGGQHFRNSFSQQRRPYHWDALMPGDQLAKHVGEWYCKTLHGKKASFAGQTGTDPQSQNPPNNDIRNKNRVLGVISTDDPENMNTVKQVLAPELRKCGATVAHEFYYAQDIARAEEQRRLSVAKMRENPESTSIMCFCDSVAPVFLYRTQQEQSYFPEEILVGTDRNDNDQIGQGNDTNGTLCRGCRVFENSLGLRSLPQQESFQDNFATRIYKRMGGNLPIDWTKYVTVDEDLDYWMMIGTLLQGAGPQLTPANVEKGAFSTGFRGGVPEIADSHFNKRGFKPGQYGWYTDMEPVYWSQRKVSEFNGRPGAWAPVASRRFDIGEHVGGDLPIPDKPR
jgi:hypothetical protein